MPRLAGAQQREEQTAARRARRTAGTTRQQRPAADAIRQRAEGGLVTMPTALPIATPDSSRPLPSPSVWMPYDRPNTDVK